MLWVLALVFAGTAAAQPVTQYDLDVFREDERMREWHERAVREQREDRLRAADEAARRNERERNRRPWWEQ